MRTAGDPVALTPALRRVVQELDPDLPVYGMRTYASTSPAARPRSICRAWAASWPARGVLGLALALMGLFTVIAFVAGQRTHEIGIRMALGSSSGRVVALIMRDGVRLILTGLALGALGSLGATSVLARLLYGVRPAEPLTLAAVAAALTAVALLACYWSRAPRGQGRSDGGAPMRMKASTT